MSYSIRAIEEVEIIYDSQYQIAIELLQKILTDSELDNDTITKLFMSAIHNLSEEQCKVYIPQLNLDGDYISIFEGKRPKIRINETNERILTIM